LAEKVGSSEKDIKKFLEEIDIEMDEYKETYISKGWEELPDFYLGKTHWGEYRPSHKVSPVLNFLRQSIERRTSQMTDSKPFIDIFPYYDPLQDVADALVEILKSKWAEQSLDMTVTDMIFYAEMFGSSGVNTLYDKTLRFGKGDTTMQCIDPRNLNFDPSVTASQYVDRGEYVRIEQIMPTSLLKTTYDNNEIKADAPFELIRDRKRITPKGRIARAVLKNIQKSAIDRSIVKEYWLQDRAKSRGHLKYPGGRHIIVAGGEIAIDEKNPYWDQRFPIDMLDWHRNPDSAWGEGDIRDMMELQRLLNKLIAIVVENGLLMTNAIWIGDSTALDPEEWEQLDNVPGLKVKKKPGTEIRREVGEPVPQTLFQVITYLENAIQKLTGNTEVVSGSTPGEVKSGTAIEALQTAALSIIRLKSRAVESLLERVGQKWIARIFQFEADERNMFSFKSQSDYEKFKFTRDMLKGPSKFFRNKEDAWKNFLFKIRPGSSLAMNNWQKSLLAMQMFQAQPKPLLDRLAVLETMDWPGRSDVLARLEAEEQAQMEQMMAMQAAMGATPPSGMKGGSAPSVSDIRSPHAAQGAQEAMRKGTGGMP
jgi:hypothetical protein